MVTTPEPNGKTELPTEKPVDKDDASMAKLAPDDRASCVGSCRTGSPLMNWQLWPLNLASVARHCLMRPLLSCLWRWSIISSKENNINYLLAEALRQRYDSGMAQLSAKLPTGDFLS